MYPYTCDFVSISTILLFSEHGVAEAEAEFKVFQSSVSNWILQINLL